MITGIRSAIICEAVDYVQGEYPIFRGVTDDRLWAQTRPGIVQFTLALQVATDKRPTKVEIRYEFDSFEECVDYPIPIGVGVATLVLPMTIPVSETGILTIAISDPMRNGKPFKYDWHVDFIDGAHDLDARQTQGLFHAAVEKMRAELAPN